MATWRLAQSLTVLRAEVNARWPNRSKVSDGTVGDLAHADRTSDHNPNDAGVVRAMDITAAGIDAPWYAEHIRKLGKAGHPALANHGYVIWNRRAAYATNSWTWVAYRGANPHDKHVHVSVGRAAAQYDNRQTWHIATDERPDNLELTVSEFTELKAQNDAIRKDLLNVGIKLRELERSIHGLDDDDRDASIYWNTKYLRAELISGANLTRLRTVLSTYGVDAAVADRVVDDLAHTE